MFSDIILMEREGDNEKIKIYLSAYAWLSVILHLADNVKDSSAKLFS